MQEIDAADVLQRYSETLSNSKHVVADVESLPYPKQIIHAVLVDGLKRFKDAESQNILSTAFLSLANFQSMTDDEREATSALAAIVAPTSKTDLKALAIQTAEHLESHSAVIARSSAELEMLREELRAILSQV